MTVRAHPGYYMGRLTNESPTNWVLTTCDEGHKYTSEAGDGQPMYAYATTAGQEDGNAKRHTIINVSYTKTDWFERGYANEGRLMPPTGGLKEGDEIEMFEAAKLSSIKPRRQARGPGKPRVGGRAVD